MAAVLRGITWGHSRGITPLLAASQRYSELHPGVVIEWKKRTLQEFADAPIEELTREYDLLIIDHPWVGTADATKCVLPLNEFLPVEYIDDQLTNSVGYSHLSYNYNQKQWALAIDAATPAASYRPDLFLADGRSIPATWEDVLALASEGKVAVPAIPIDLLMMFYSFCIANGKEPFLNGDECIDEATGVKAIHSMKSLYKLVDKKMFFCNPIAVAELMSSTDQYWYCPFAYCYSNYARTGFAKYRLAYTRPVSFNGKSLRTTIGGTGLAVSAFSHHKSIAIDFAQWICSADLQSHLYIEHGGQPGHRKAWISKESNLLTHDFFNRLISVMDEGYMRPRYHGYLYFQDHAGDPLHECLLQDLDPVETLNKMNRIYRNSFAGKKLTTAV